MVEGWISECKNDPGSRLILGGVHMKLKRCAFLFVIGIIMVLCCVCAAVDIFAGGDGNLYDISSAILFGVLGVLYLISYGLVSSHHASGKGFAMLSLALTAVWTAVVSIVFFFQGRLDATVYGFCTAALTLLLIKLLLDVKNTPYEYL